MSRRASWLWVNAGVLVLGLAVYGCSSDDSGLDMDDAGDGQGGSLGAGQDGGLNAGGGNVPGNGGNGPSGEGGAVGGGGNSPAQGGASAQGGNGGAAVQGGNGGAAAQGGRGGATQSSCSVGSMCTNAQTCMGSCNANGQPGTRSCLCVGNGYFCGECVRNMQADAGVMLPNACPANPQGTACTQSNGFCAVGTGAMASVCICSNEKFFCPGLAAPQGSAACPTNPQGKSCQETGSVCSASATTSCLCRQGRNNQRAWVCGFNP